MVELRLHVSHALRVVHAHVVLHAVDVCGHHLQHTDVAKRSLSPFDFFGAHLLLEPKHGTIDGVDLLKVRGQP